MASLRSGAARLALVYEASLVSRRVENLALLQALRPCCADNTH